jgi:phospholipid/cholesterol/gamma-HCH transport system substrate-binding protein
VATRAAETLIGALVLGVAGGFLVYAGRSAERGIGEERYALTASFHSVEGIAIGTDVRLAGIKVGAVTGLDLDRQTYRAFVTFAVEKALQIPEDSGMKIASEGLLGGSYLEITPGTSEFMLADGDEVLDTHGPESLLNLLMRFGAGN